MTASVWAMSSSLRSVAAKALHGAGRLWFVTAVAGQWIFVAYVILFYGRSASRGDFEQWNKVMPHGYVSGDLVGNVIVAAHLLLAVIILAGGPLQFVPAIRRKAPAFHRWNGRVYLITVFATSIAGLYMTWLGRGAVGDLVQHIGITMDAALIFLFGVMAVRRAIARDIPAHRRWVLRLFLTTHAVWFFRIGVMLWIFIHRGPAGFDPETFTGPFLSFWSFGDYLLPLAILELYLRAERGSTGARLAMACALVVVTIATAVGIFAATVAMWLPRI